MAAFANGFPGASISGCYFHLNQSLLRKVGNLGLKGQFDAEIDFKLQVKSLAALSMVPIGDVDNVFNQLAATFPQDQALGMQ